MKLALKVEVQPTTVQLQALLQHAGVARWAFNWGLHKKQNAWVARKADLEAGVPMAEAPRVPSAIDLHKELNLLKKLPIENGGVPWMYESSKAAPQEALRNLDVAFDNFFRRIKAGGKPGYPKFKSKHQSRPKFKLTGSIRATTKYVQLPRIGRLRLKPGEQDHLPTGPYSQISVSEKAGRWYVSVLGPNRPDAPISGAEPIGLDVGVAVLATLSDSTTFKNPCALRNAEHKLAHKQRNLARKKKGSNNRKKAKLKVAKAYARVTNIRLDAIHKATTAIAKQYSRVVIEDLKVSNMTRAAKGKGRAAKTNLNRSVLDASFGELRRQLEYKGKLYGCEIVAINPAYTSQRCSTCGHTEKTNRLSQSTFKCVFCGHTENADLNAAKNILVAGSCPETLNACGGVVRPVRACPGGCSDEAGINMIINDHVLSNDKGSEAKGDESYSFQQQFRSTQKNTVTQPGADSPTARL